MTDDIPWLSAVDIASRVRAGDLSPVEVVEAFLARIERRNPDTNAYVTVCADRAREDAERAERAVEAGEELGPLHGVPVAIKDMNRVAGVRKVRDQIESAVREAAEADEWMREHPPEVEWFGWACQPHEVPEDAEIVQLSLDNAEAVCGKRGSLVGGNASLDERFFQRYYDIPVATVGPWGANLHGADEHTTTESLVETAQTVVGIALDYCGVAEE